MLSINKNLELLADLISKIEASPKYFVMLKKSLKLIVKELSMYKNEYLANAIDVAIYERCMPRETKEYKIRRALTSIKYQVQVLSEYKNNPTVFKHACSVIKLNAREAKTLLDEMFDVFPIPEIPLFRRWGEHQSHFLKRKVHAEKELERLKKEKKI